MEPLNTFQLVLIVLFIILLIFALLDTLKSKKDTDKIAEEGLEFQTDADKVTIIEEKYGPDDGDVTVVERSFETETGELTEMKVYEQDYVPETGELNISQQTFEPETGEVTIIEERYEPVTEELVQPEGISPDLASTERGGETESLLDDLKVIEGIGPKMASILNQAGIKTYSSLANTSVEKLDEILSAANMITGRTKTWPDQARLAADGNWEELKILQDSLKGGL